MPTITLRATLIAAYTALVLGACNGPNDDAGTTTTAPSPSSPSSTLDQPATSSTLAPELSVRTFEVFPVPSGSRPHDVWAATDGRVWYTGQNTGVLGVLDPVTGDIHEIPLGDGSRPHGVIEGPAGDAWVTDGGLNAIVRVDTATDSVEVFPLPGSAPDANLNTATFFADGTLWFTGQAGVYGRLAPGATEVEVFDAGGRGPYGITATGDAVYYASLAGSHIGRVDPVTGELTRIEPPTAGQGTRRVWADSQDRIWSSQWEAGQVAVYDPGDGSWQEFGLPGDAPTAYSVFVDHRDIVWLSDFAANALVRFDPATETFDSYPLPGTPSNVRQIHGRAGELWLPESAADQLVLLRTG